MVTATLPQSGTQRTCSCGTPIFPFTLPGGTEWYASACAACVRKQDEEYEQQQREERLDKLGYQRRYENATFDNLSDPKPAEHKIEAIRFYAVEIASEERGTGKGLYLWGPNGTGKTHLAVAISKVVARSLFLNTLRLFDALKDSYANKEPCRAFEQARSAPLLILDDLGSERPSGWVQERFYALVNTRWDEMLPTVVTSNYSPRELEDIVGARTASRILGTCLTILIDGPDHRSFSTAAV